MCVDKKKNNNNWNKKCLTIFPPNRLYEKLVSDLFKVLGRMIHLIIDFWNVLITPSQTLHDCDARKIRDEVSFRSSALYMNVNSNARGCHYVAKATLARSAAAAPVRRQSSEARWAAWSRQVLLSGSIDTGPTNLLRAKPKNRRKQTNAKRNKDLGGPPMLEVLPFFVVLLNWISFLQQLHRPFFGSIVVSIPACHAGDPGSIPGRRGSFFSPHSLSLSLFLAFFVCSLSFSIFPFLTFHFFFVLFASKRLIFFLFFLRTLSIAFFLPKTEKLTIYCTKAWYTQIYTEILGRLGQRTPSPKFNNQVLVVQVCESAEFPGRKWSARKTNSVENKINDLGGMPKCQDSLEKEKEKAVEKEEISFQVLSTMLWAWRYGAQINQDFLWDWDRELFSRMHIGQDNWLCICTSMHM